MSETWDQEALKRYWRGSRDSEAKKANTAYQRQHRATADPDSWEIRAGTTISQNDSAALNQRLTELRISESDYIRDLIYGDLGITDTARRPAPRQPKRQQRKDGTR